MEITVKDDDKIFCFTANSIEFEDCGLSANFPYNWNYNKSSNHLDFNFSMTASTIFFKSCHEIENPYDTKISFKNEKTNKILI